MKFQFDFTGRRVLITDAASPIGMATAGAFHELGARVAVNAASAAQVNDLIEHWGAGSRFVPAPGQLATAEGRREATARALDQLGGLDILINCADHFETARVEQIDPAGWQRMIDANVKAVFFTTQHCLEALKASRGSIINVASVFGLLAGPAGTAAYSASKGAVVQMTRMLALHLAHQGVRVNAIAPSLMDSEAQGGSDQTNRVEIQSSLQVSTPLGRMGSAEECAGAILYLAAPFATFTTGAILAGDGGLSAGH